MILLISTSLCFGEPAVGIICTLDDSDRSVVEIEEELQVVEAEEEGAHIVLVDYFIVRVGVELLYLEG